MKTKVKLIFAISLIAALFVGFLIGISVDYPKLEKSDLAGTFGKAEKFRKVQMSQKDIQLRTDLVKDTAKLKSMIQGLIYFSLFTEELRTDLDLCTISFQSQGMGAQPADADKIKIMKDYSDFIRNNNVSLNATILMLNGFYRNEGADASQDVEKTLQDFGNYVKNLNNKDSVLSKVLVNMDEYLLNSKALQSRKTEFQQLKSIRDQLLIKGIQLGGLLGNKENVVSMMKYAIGSQLNMYAANAGGVQAVGIQQDLGIFSKTLDNAGVQSNLDVLIGVNFSSRINSGLGSNDLAVVYNFNSLQFGVMDKQAFAALQQSLASESAIGTRLSKINLNSGAVDAVLMSNELKSMNVQPLGLLSVSGNLNIVMSQYSASQTLQSNALAGISTDAAIKILEMSTLNSSDAKGSMGIADGLKALNSSIFNASSLGSY